jgi:hypothetical protein
MVRPRLANKHGLRHRLPLRYAAPRLSGFSRLVWAVSNPYCSFSDHFWPKTQQLSVSGPHAAYRIYNPLAKDAFIRHRRWW